MPTSSQTHTLIPVTILTGFLGSGKTTLLNRILQESHGQRIAIIENEFGEAGIDNELLIQDQTEQIIEMNNGCICCSVRGDLIRILGELQTRHREGKAQFDRVIIETTGLATPGPVAQTFFVDEAIRDFYRLDAVITLVDAKHTAQHLTEHAVVAEQIGFADVLLLTKTDLVDEADTEALQQRLRQMNARAQIHAIHVADTSLNQLFSQRLFDLKAFNINDKIEIAPDFLHGHHHHSHHHHDEITSFVFRSERPFNYDLLEETMSAFISVYGAQMLRYKGVLYVKGQPQRGIFQGVHTLLGGDMGKPWGKDEKKESVLVFIGKNLPQDTFTKGLTNCLVK